MPKNGTLPESATMAPTIASHIASLLSAILPLAGCDACCDGASERAIAWGNSLRCVGYPHDGFESRLRKALSELNGRKRELH
jgi:hypothetical protein